VAGLVRFELGNVRASYVLNNCLIYRNNLPEAHAELASRDYPRLSCDMPSWSGALAAWATAQLKRARSLWQGLHPNQLVLL
jgi:hypothetical protein